MLIKDNKQSPDYQQKINKPQIFNQFIIIENVIATACRYSQTIKL